MQCFTYFTCYLQLFNNLHHKCPGLPCLVRCSSKEFKEAKIVLSWWLLLILTAVSIVLPNFNFLYYQCAHHLYITLTQEVVNDQFVLACSSASCLIIRLWVSSSMKGPPVPPEGSKGPGVAGLSGVVFPLPLGFSKNTNDYVSTILQFYYRDSK